MLATDVAVLPHLLVEYLTPYALLLDTPELVLTFLALLICDARTLYTSIYIIECL